MKRRRDPVTSCEDCAKQFESNESHQRHLSSRSHIQTTLAIRNLAMMQCDEFLMDKANDLVSNDADGSGSASENEYDLPYPEDEMEVDEFQENEIPPLNNEDNGTDGEDEDFYPFPNEKFFLLYCYAHSIMRPKVNILFHKFLIDLIAPLTKRCFTFN